MIKKILVMIDECGDEVEVERYNIDASLDEDWVSLWEAQKIHKAKERYPEARSFYIEDRSAMEASVRAAVRDFFGGCWEEEWEDEE